MRFALLALALLVLGTKAASTAQAEPYTHPATALVFPDLIGALKREPDAADFEAKQAGLGTGITYRAPGVTVSIYLYTLRLPEVSADLASPVLKAQFDQAAADVHRAAALGHYSGVKQDESNEVVWSEAPEAVRSHHTRFAYLQRGTERLSHLDLAAVKNHFFKIRFTYDRSVSDDAEKMRSLLLVELDRAARAVRN